MKIDLSKEQGTLVPLYFFRKPLGWPAEYRREQDTTRSARRSHQMALCAIKATPASALPTVTCGYVGDPKGGGTAPSTKRPEENEK